MLRDFITATAPRFGCTEEDTFAFELACDEAAANVFHHALPSKRGTVEVCMWRADADVIVQLKYHGRAFDPAQVPEPDLDAPLEERPIGGLGLYFMRQMMTQVSFEFDAADGNIVTLRRCIQENRG